MLSQTDLDLNDTPKFEFEIEECRDRHGNLLKAGDLVRVELTGDHTLYTKGRRLMFKADGKELRVSDYFSNDLSLRSRIHWSAGELVVTDDFPSLLALSRARVASTMTSTEVGPVGPAGPLNSFVLYRPAERGYSVVASDVIEKEK